MSDSIQRPTLQVIIASTRPGRVGLPVGTWVAERARQHGGFAVEIADLAEIALPLFDEPEHPRLGRYTHEHSRRWSERIARSDAFVFVFPEYNHGYPATLKNAIDFLAKEWAFKPVSLVSYGGASGGIRAAAGLLPVLTVLKLLPIAGSLSIANVSSLVSNGVFTGTESHAATLRRILDEIARVTPIAAQLRS